MAAMAGLGGVASTAINALGDVMQAALGFAGTTQWAAGLHTIFLLLVVGLVRKGGAATLAGLLKGAVELLSGNTHGIIILLVDLAAGLIIDLVFALVQQRQSLLVYILAGAFSAASNVIVFQLFALAPEDVLAAVWLVALVAAVSGALLGGWVAWLLLGVLHKNGLVREEPVRTMRGWRYAVFLGVFALILIGGSWTMVESLAGPPVIDIRVDGEVVYQFSPDDDNLPLIVEDVELNGIKRSVSGYKLAEVIALAVSGADYGSALISATDGYSFFITDREIEENTELLLAVSGEGEDTSYEIVGAENSKAWVRNVATIDLAEQTLIEVSGLVGLPSPYNPADWQYEMDSAYLDVGYGEQKYQGTIAADVLTAWEPSTGAESAVFYSADEQVELSLEEIATDRSLRIWSVNAAGGTSFALATEGGEILLTDVERIEVK